MSTTTPTRFARPSDTDDEGRVPDKSPEQAKVDERLHALCEQWAYWSRTRRLYGSPRLSASVLGRLSGATSHRPLVATDAPCSPLMACLHIAIDAQPKSIDRIVFELHYVHRVRNIKTHAAQLDISRAHWYRLLSDFRVRVVRQAEGIYGDRMTQSIFTDQ